MKKADKYKMKNQTNMKQKSRQKYTGWGGAQSVGGLEPSCLLCRGTKGSRPLAAGPKSVGRWQKIHSGEKSTHAKQNHRPRQVKNSKWPKITVNHVNSMRRGNIVLSNPKHQGRRLICAQNRWMYWFGYWPWSS